MRHDLVVRGGRVLLGGALVEAEVGVLGGRVATLGAGLDGAEALDASGLLVLPGGVDTHTHVEEPQPDGTVHEESWESASRSALAGGTTTLVAHTPQFRGEGLLGPHRAARGRAGRAMVDHGFHQIVADPSDAALSEVPGLAAEGVGSLKAFLTYEALRLDDAGFLAVLGAAKASGLMVHVHCENDALIARAVRACLAAGQTSPKYHALTRPVAAEREATGRAIALAEAVGQPIQVFHVSCAEAAEEVARARDRGLPVSAETCPQYLVLTAADMDRPGFEGAKFMCSPPPRGPEEAERLWAMIRRGVLGAITSDHCGFSYGGGRGKAKNGRDASFDRVPNGIPGLAARLPIVFSEGVSAGRIGVAEFSCLVSEEPARVAGLYPRKGAIAVGSDADLVLWDPGRRVTITNGLMQHALDYTPYEGLVVRGWPVATVRRGEAAMRDGAVLAAPGSGAWLPRGPAFPLAR